MKKVLLPLLILSFTVTTGCTAAVEESADANGIHNQVYPSVDQVLSKEEDADIFRYQNRIYKTGMQSLENMELEKQEQVTTIKSIYKDGGTFEQDMATVLPKGTKIFATSEDGILIAEHDGEEYRYLALIED